MIRIVLLAATAFTATALQASEQGVMLDSGFSSAMTYEELVEVNDQTGFEPDRPTGGLILHQSMKNRPGMLDFFATQASHHAGAALREPQATEGSTIIEDTEAKAWFAAFCIIMAGFIAILVWFANTKAFIQLEDEEALAGPRDVLNDDEFNARLKYIRYVKGLPCYNFACPTFTVIISMVMFFATIGAVNNTNMSIALEGAKSTTQSGFEGVEVERSHTTNAGERAFFAGFGLFFQMTLGALFVLWLRKAANVKVSIAMLSKYAMRGGAIAFLATMIVELLHLPFQDVMKSDSSYLPRILFVLFVCGVFAFIEEVGKLGMVAAGLKHQLAAPADEEASESTDFVTEVLKMFRSVLEGPEAVALCGLCTGVGFAFIENIPRFLAVATEPPINTDSFSMKEADLRQVRVWTFVFWVLLNLQPWLTGIASLRFALKSTKGPLDVKDWIEVLTQVVLLHAGFDLLDRSSSPVIEFIGCCAIPYSMNVFRKQWNSLEGVHTEGFDAMFDEEAESVPAVRV